MSGPIVIQKYSGLFVESSSDTSTKRTDKKHHVHVIEVFTAQNRKIPQKKHTV